MEYIPGNFAKLANSDLGKRLWAFLQEEGSLIRMETSTYLSRPALEGLQPALIERFGEEIMGDDADSIKRMVGSMTRQVMESRGYQIEQSSVRLRQKDYFMTATRYTK